MFKKTIFTLLTGIILCFTSAVSYAGYCLVTTESDSSTNGGSLRYKIETTYASGSRSNCTPPASDPGDDDYFDQVVIFDTAEMCADGADCTDNVETITLGSKSKKNRQLTFDNSSQDIVIGNWSPDVVNDSEAVAVVGYDEDYIEALETAGEYGNVTIDAQKYFDAGTIPFKCESKTKEVYLRNLTIKTNGVTKDELFDGKGDDSCLKNAGDVTVDPGETAEEEDTDADGDRYYVDGPDDGSTCGESTGGGLSLNRCDCDDDDASVHPYATETCNSTDDDCDGSVDEGDVCGGGGEDDDDADNDGYDSEASGGTDCNDSDASVNPAATEVCADGIDNNCDDYTAETGDFGCNTDADADGYYSEDVGGNDCNDTADDADGDTVADGYDINPGIDESADTEGSCDDDIDNDCDGGTDSDGGPNEDGGDDGCPDETDVDDDGDGYTETEGDCDDADPTINPDISEYDAGDDDIDNDCDGGIDENFVGESADDDDGDGFCEDSTACADETITAGDCDDSTETISPSIVEVCDDGIDNNCRDGIDDGCTGETDVDDDSDGYTEEDGDCDDSVPTVYPTAEEDPCDDEDTNCDGAYEGNGLGPVCSEGEGEGGSSGCGCDVNSSHGSANYFELLLGFLALAATRLVSGRKLRRQ